jgi:hypothetical protein
VANRRGLRLALRQRGKRPCSRVLSRRRHSAGHRTAEMAMLRSSSIWRTPAWNLGQHCRERCVPAAARPGLTVSRQMSRADIHLALGLDARQCVGVKALLAAGAGRHYVQERIMWRAYSRTTTQRSSAWVRGAAGAGSLHRAQGLGLPDGGA